MNSYNFRQAFINQNGQYLIIDLAEMTMQVLKNIINAIQHILTLACSVRGGVRIPAFGLSILREDFNQILELDIIQGNYNKIIAALNCLNTYAQINDKANSENYKDILHLGINSAVRACQNLHEKNKMSNNLSKIEITLLTVKNCFDVQSCLETFINDIEVTKIHKIIIIELENNEYQNTNKNSNQSAFIESFCLNGSVSQFENYFKTWLLDRCENVDALLHFPGPQASHLTIKCDIVECILNPLSLPFGHRFLIQTDSLSVQLNGISSVKTAPANILVYELNVVSRIKSTNICESMLFGMPLCFKTTQSWQLSLEEKQSNKQHFSELCRQLIVAEEFLIVRMKQCYQTDQFLPYYLLIPGDDCLLIKSFASSELMMPWKNTQRIRDERSVESSVKVFSSLQNVHVIDDINIERLDSGLLLALTCNLKHAQKRNIFDLDDSPVAKKLKRDTPATQNIEKN